MLTMVVSTIPIKWMALYSFDGILLGIAATNIDDLKITDGEGRLNDEHSPQEILDSYIKALGKEQQFYTMPNHNTDTVELWHRAPSGQKIRIRTFSEESIEDGKVTLKVLKDLLANF